MQGLWEASTAKSGAGSNDGRKHKMIYHRMNFLFFFFKLSQNCLLLLQIQFKMLQAEHAAREKPLSRKCTAVSVSLLWELAVSQGLRVTLT